MPSTRTSAKRLRLPAHCLIAKYGRGCRIPVVSRRPMRASRCVVFTLRRCAPPSGWRLDSGDRVVTWRHLDLRAVLRDGKGNLGDWTSSGKALEKRLCLRPLPTADSARRCNTPTARAVFSMLQRPAESETRSNEMDSSPSSASSARLEAIEPVVGEEESTHEAYAHRNRRGQAGLPGPRG